MKQIGRTRFRCRRSLDRFQQTFAVDRFGENFRRRNFEALLRGGIGGKEKDLQPGKNFAERTAERETVDAGRFQLREQETAAGMLVRPFQRGRIAPGQIALVHGVIVHHSRQLPSDLSVIVDDEQLHYCEGAVKGGGKRFSSFVGSARTAWSWSL